MYHKHVSKKKKMKLQVASHQLLQTCNTSRYTVVDSLTTGVLTLTVAHPLNKVLEGLSKFSRLRTNENRMIISKKKKIRSDNCVAF